jgi:hypothetical protein
MTNKYQVILPLNSEEYAHLKRDIAENGVLIPVEYDEDGNILDGHHRVQACQELGITDWPRTVRKNLSEDDKRAFARRVNLVRRQLNREQKQELIRQQLIETPEKSDRQVANDLGVDHKTVSTQRANAESTGEIPQLKKTTGADGKTRSRKRKQTDASESNNSTTPSPTKTKSNNTPAIKLPTNAVSELQAEASAGRIKGPVAKRIAILPEVEQRFVVHNIENLLGPAEAKRYATEHNRVTYDRAGNRYDSEQNSVPPETTFPLEEDTRCFLNAAKLFSSIRTPPELLGFHMSNNGTLTPEEQKVVNQFMDFTPFFIRHNQF